MIISFKNNFFFSTLIIISLLIFTSCAGNKSNNIEYNERSLSTIYNTALDNLINEDFEEAALQFDEVERQHPYSEWAKKSIIMSSYSSFKNRDYLKSEANLKRFLELYPASTLAAYAQFLLSMCYYSQINDIKRDQTSAKLAYEGFQLIMDRYPNTKYAENSYYKLILLENYLAAKEMDVAMTYVSLKKYISSLKRYKEVVNNYQSSSYVPEALFRLVEIYLILGVRDEAIINARVLGYNYPKSKWYKYCYRLLKKNNLINKKKI